MDTSVPRPFQNYMLTCDGRDCWVFLAQDTRHAQKVIRQARHNGLAAKVVTFRPVSAAEIARHFGRLSDADADA